mmetsp:Transcript_1821/g.4157  ORF Transcript_1821/g.4157 Transcript_1821/m.4157 type:complete len:330 (+) Transcript_1821:148-1137(+)
MAAAEALEARTGVEGLIFPEGPRWRRGSLFVSDQYDRKVWKITPRASGEEGAPAPFAKEEVVAVPNQPSGTGWLADGTMLVVSMTDRKLLKLRESPSPSLEEHADLSSLATFHCNDMAVDGTGRAYVGNFGFDLFAESLLEKSKFALYVLLHRLLGQTHAWLLQPANLICVEPDGRARVAATDLMFPNGTVVTPDGKTLVVAETLATRLTAFDIAPNGDLSNRRVWAEVPRGAAPDGICLDEAGGIWVANLLAPEVIRVTEGATKGGRGVTHRMRTSQPAFACMLGGEDGKTLFACTAPSHIREKCEEGGSRRGKIEYCTAPYARAGWP